MDFFRDHPNAFHLTRLLVAGLLAVLCALAIIYGVLTLRSASNAGDSSGTSLSEQEKMHILAGLSASTTPSENEKRDMLNTMHDQSAGSKQMSEEEKLRILQSL